MKFYSSTNWNIQGYFKLTNWLFFLSTITFITGFALTIISWLRLCSSTCIEGHNYRIYGFAFETLGFVFFPILLAMHLFSYKFPILATLVGWFICAALGSEIMFIYVQKYKIGSWCPVCLSIAGTLIIAGMIYFYGYYTNFKNSLIRENKGEIMNGIYKGISGLCFFVIGFVFAFSGIGKYSKLQAMENDIKNQIVFGNLNSPIEVYIFTDWACGGCRAIEPTLEAMAPKIMKKAKVTFVDQEVHPVTLNFIPFNLSFMINNKSKYFELRRALTKLAMQTSEPTDAQVAALAKNHGTQYKQLNNADVQVGTKYFEKLVEQLKVEGTPSVVIISRNDKKGKKLMGPEEITEANIMRAINSF
ncbi:MAG: thioredoxin domain-containing protein [Parachlamydiaceae bacterium]|nr:thioredoxin domain-containing protein [Parachlamydiaceae bacterium]